MRRDRAQRRVDHLLDVVLLGGDQTVLPWYGEQREEPELLRCAQTMVSSINSPLFWTNLSKGWHTWLSPTVGGEINGRPRQPSHPPPSGSASVASQPTAQIVEQTTSVVDPPAVTVEEMITTAKSEKES